LVCTTNLAVSDETDEVCATKADGRYRCWTNEPLAALPQAKYRRVQATPRGSIGLTQDGKLFAVGIELPAALPSVVEFNSTNMWGGQGVCYRTAHDGPLFIFDYFVDDPKRETDPIDTAFRQVRCVWEGIVIGVRTDGAIWSNAGARLQVPADTRFQSVSLGLGILCGLDEAGRAWCGKSLRSEDQCAIPGQDFTGNCHPIPGIPALVSFPGGPYVQIATTRRVGCALAATGELLCLRRDGAVIPTPPGLYTFIEAGMATLCAIRSDGTSACWRHDGDDDAPPPFNDVTRFDDVRPALDSDW
jgi:hypothetical protein